MAQVMESRSALPRGGIWKGFLHQLPKRTFHRGDGQRLSMLRNKEVFSGDPLIASLLVGFQRSDGAGMQGNQTVPLEFGVANNQHSLRQVHIGLMQLKCFRNPQTSTGEQAEQRSIGPRT